MKVTDLTMKVLDRSTAKIFIEKYHYSKSCPPSKITIALGFYYKDKLSTVIVYGQPSGRNLAKSIWDGGDEKECLELNRLFSHDWCPKNTESYCIGQSFKYIRENFPHIKVLVSYADSNYGHYGYIYQATNWIYTGIGSNERALFIDGKRVHRRELFDIYGTSSMKFLKEKYGNRFTYSDRNPKYRYVYILGSKKERKEIIKKLKYQQLPYPKSEATLEWIRGTS